jgi:hypothetical protein
VVLSIFSTVFSQSLASIGSAAWRTLGVMAHELTMLVEWRQLLHRSIVNLSLQVGHSVCQVLKELGLGLEKLLHGRIHLS